jgi:hypothetical protein
VGLLAWVRRLRNRTAPGQPAAAQGVPGTRPDPADLYRECAGAVRAFTTTVADLGDGVITDRLRALALQLPPLLTVAERLAGIASTPPGAAIAGAQAAAVLGEGEAIARLTGLRDALTGIAQDATRVARSLTVDPAGTTAGAALAGLGAGLADARGQAWGLPRQSQLGSAGSDELAEQHEHERQRSR